MKCTLKYVLFPKDGQESDGGFTVCDYVCNDDIKNNSLASTKEGSNLNGKTFRAVGYYLPRSKALQYDIEGTWQETSYGRSLLITKIDEKIENNEIGIIAYLTSGLISGVGPKTAKLIYKEFGDKTLDVLDNNPEKLLKIPGISKRKLEKIISSLTAYRGARDIVSELAPFGISSSKAVKIYNKYKENSTEIIKTNPFKMYGSKDISFKVADSISEKQGLPTNSNERCKSALYEVLQQLEYSGYLFTSDSENSDYVPSGSLCMPYPLWIKKAKKIINDKRVTNAILEKLSLKMANLKIIKFSKHPETQKLYVYKYATALAEHETAEKLISLKKFPTSITYDIEDEIRLLELENGFRLAPEQNKAVIMGLKNNVSIITGGPGTGKTTIINFIHSIYRRNNKGKRILLCAPTAMAAKVMSNATGANASTIHVALGLTVSDGGKVYCMNSILDADFIIVDEISMLDAFVANLLVAAIKKGSKIVFIGDVAQLPSVAPGAILSGLIESNCFPVMKLQKIYRQKEGSAIPLNAALIEKGKTSLDFDDNEFSFINSNSFSDSKKKMIEEFSKYVAIYGIDNVLMLSPFRSAKTETGVDAINPEIRNIVNPSSPNKKEISFGSKLFRVGDKVMELKNTKIGEISLVNGSIGYISAIQKSPDNYVTIDFGEGNIVDCYQQEMESITLAYATTVHKSQGTESKIVIFNLLNGHDIMLKRNLVYTGITRAKLKVIIIGEKTALNKAILTGMTKKEKRITFFAIRLQMLDKK